MNERTARDNPALSASLASKRGFVVCLVATAILTAVCLFLPPFHTLTHEFTSLYTVLSAALLFFTASAYARAKARARGEVLLTTTASQAQWHMACLAIAMAALALSIMLGGNVVAFQCRIGAGIPYFLLTALPAALVACTAGTVLGALGAGKKTVIAAFASALLLSAAHDGLQLYLGPRVYPVDFLLGDLAAFSQRGGMRPSALHLYERCFVALFTWCLWDVGRWRLAARDVRQHVDAQSIMGVAKGRAALLGSALVVTVLFAGSHFGIGFGRGALHRAYDQVEITEHFEIHYSRNSELLAEVEEIKRDAEWNWHYLTQLLGIEPEGRVRLYLFETQDDLQTFTGLSYAHAGLGELFMDYESALTSVLLHELVHALHRSLKPSPFILLNRGMLEGTATAFEGAYTLVPDAHEFQAAALEAGKLPRARSFMSLSGFSQNAEGAAYESAGSFLGFLVLQYGLEDFMALQRSLDFEKTYQKDLDALDAEWRAFLSGLKVSPGLYVLASRFFDLDENPSYRVATCPKVGKEPPSTLVQAKQFFDLGLYVRASALYLDLYREEEKVEWARRAALSLEKEEDYPGALAILQEAEGNESLKDFERAALLADRILLHVRQRDWPALYLDYEERSASDTGVPMSNQLGEACLRQPRIREAYAAAITEDDPVARALLYREMLEKEPEFPPLLYLYARFGLGAGAPLEERARALFEVPVQSEEMAVLVASELLSLYKKAIGEQDYDLANGLYEKLLRLSPKVRHRLAAELGQVRIQFERDGGVVRITDVITGAVRHPSND